MTVKELFSVQHDENKLRSLHIELARHEDFNPYKSNIISDMPKGSGGKNFSEWYAERGDRIRREIALYENKLIEDEKKVNDYINSAPRPECDIIRFRVINNLSWEEIGAYTGYSGRQVSRKFWNYLKKDVQNVQDVSGKV
ncbi:hypothetical protein PMF13cell1_05603 [Blautia producta]|uniref:Sigma-70 family RNA polymerase sigma factor n=1 Tax=Blautia producta TaxID=33035 RepID=A0A4P6M8U8_9FIRM|nr:hypothetical protein [Blautia producta]QBF00008.1 hypothetical protein PMF13cell1_05603 [Blautia producta]